MKLSVPQAVLLVAVAAGAAEPPLGSRDFYPSTERPIGFRGDGNGAFPGATPVIDFREGDAEQRKVAHVVYNSGSPVPRRSDRTAWVFTNDTKVNIVWKAKMPDFSNSSPIVVGDRVFCMAEPYTLVCVSAHTGRILWQRDTNPLEIMGRPKEEVDRVTEIMELTHAVHAVKGNITGNYGRLPSYYRPEYAEPWRRQILVARRLARRARELKADGADKLLAVIDEVLRDIEALPVRPDPAKRAKPDVEEIVRGDDEPAPPGADTPPQPDAALYRGLAGKISRLHLLLEGPLRKTYGFYVADHWAGMVGVAFATPVSDGRHVYVSIGQGQVACYDLAGRRVWARHVPVRTRWYDFYRLGNCPSPLLVGDVLIAQQVELLAGLHKRTGEMLWERPDLVVGKTYNCGSHKVVRLRGGSRRRAVVVTTGGKVIDPATGRDLADLAHEGVHVANETTPPVIATDDGQVFLYLGGVNRSYRLELTADGGVSATQQAVFVPRWADGVGMILVGGQVLAASRRSAGLYDLASGKYTAKVDDFCGYSGVGPILAGKYVVGVGPAGPTYGRERDDEQIVVDCPVVDLTDPANPKAIGGRNILGGLNKPHLRYLEKHAADLYAKGWFASLDVQTKHGTWGMEAIPSQWGYAGGAASGNRLFLRSCSHLYCIGDPDVPYDWNPASRPKQITDELAKARAE